MRMPSTGTSANVGLVVSPSIVGVRKTSEDFVHWLTRDDGEVSATCVRCPDAPCLRFTSAEIESARYSMTFDRNPAVCPFASIAMDRATGAPTIGGSCVGCGLCAARCPVGAVRIHSNKAVVDIADNGYVSLATTQREHLSSRERIRTLIRHAEEPPQPNWDARRAAVEATLDGLDSARDVRHTMGLLVRNALLSTDASAKLGVPGDTNSRTDLAFDFDERVGVAEIEQNPDLLDSARRLLADVATARSRHGIEPASLLSVIICRRLPNRRTDFYRLADDAYGVLGLRIATIPVASLLLLVRSRRTFSELGIPERFHAGEAAPSVIDDAAYVMETSAGRLRGLGFAPAK